MLIFELDTIQYEKKPRFFRRGLLVTRRVYNLRLGWLSFWYIPGGKVINLQKNMVYFAK